MDASHSMAAHKIIGTNVFIITNYLFTSQWFTHLTVPKKKKKNALYYLKGKWDSILTCTVWDFISSINLWRDKDSVSSSEYHQFINSFWFKHNN